MTPEAAPRPPRAGLLLGVAAAIAGVCWLLPASVSWRLAPDLGHAWAVPLLMAYLWWDRWNERPSLIPRSRVPAPLVAGLLLLVVAELFLRLLLTPYPLWPVALALHSAAFAAVAIIGAWLTAGRPGIRWIAGPLLLLVSTLPVPSSIESAVIIPVRELWARLAAECSNLLGLPAIAFGTSVQIGGGWVGVDEACGGIRSLQACAMIALFFGEWYRFTAARRAALLVVGLAAALLGNFGRVLFLSLRASAGAHAVEDVHDVAGAIAMGASLAATGWLALHWAGYRFPDARLRASTLNPTAGAGPGIGAAGLRLLVAIAALLLVNEVATRLWFLHGRQAHASVPQWTASFPEHHWSYRSSPLPETARTMLRPDDYRAGSWRDESAGRLTAYYIEWTQGQIARSVPFLHNPTVCLPYAGCELVATLDPISVKWAGGEIPFNACKFRRSGEEMLVAFVIWDPLRNQPLTPPPSAASWREWLAVHWTDVRLANENQPAQLLTVMLPWRPSAPTDAAAILTSVVSPTADYQKTK